MANQVVQLKSIGKVTFSQNKRSKNIKVSVKADKSVLVSFPFYVSGKEALSFVLKNEEWVRKQQSKMEQRKTKIEPGSSIETKLHTITFITGKEYNTSIQDKNIEICAPEFTSDKVLDMIDKLLTEVYRMEAKQLLPVRLAQLADKHGFTYNNVSIRNNRRNWGSCSSKNNISLNLQMMKLPVELIDHILLHELVHTEIKNHSPKFWKRLDEVSGGNARELAREVKKYSTYTL